MWVLVRFGEISTEWEEMMETNKRVSYPLGMFDLVKGLGMILIILAHTTGGVNVSGWIYYTIHVLSSSLMGAYYAFSGFQFRPTPFFGKSVKKHAKTYFPFYFRLAAVVLLCILIADPELVRGRIVGFLLGLLYGGQVGTIYAGSAVMGWFFLAIFWGSIILDVLLKIRKESIRVACIAVLCILGIYLESIYFSYFSICRGFQALPGMYIGYSISSRDLLGKRGAAGKVLPYVALATSFVAAFGYLATSFGFVNLCLVALAEILLACSAIFISRDTVNYTNGLLELVCKVGRYTPWIMIVHSAEMVCISWNEVFLGIVANEDFGFVLQVICRCFVIFLGCSILSKIDRIEKNWRRKRRSKKRAQRKVIG